MGAALLTVARRLPEVRVAAAVDQGDDLEAAIRAAQVVVDFSFHEVTPEVARRCGALGKALVIGTTGHAEGERAGILASCGNVPVVWASNFSTGVNTLFWLTRKAAEILGPGFDLEVVEMHHRHKKDAPSGTARTLAEILAEVRRVQLKDVVRHGREGLTGERTAEEIGLHALRGGEVVGDHTVIFAGPHERLELTHRAASREMLAEGALRAAVWAVGQPAGLYSMQDVLGLG
jgi:4-hydroxy-tetrahydrodipicolinate reductase